jgi:hypothetical protein
LTFAPLLCSTAEEGREEVCLTVSAASEAEKKEAAEEPLPLLLP